MLKPAYSEKALGAVGCAHCNVWCASGTVACPICTRVICGSCGEHVGDCALQKPRGFTLPGGGWLIGIDESGRYGICKLRGSTRQPTLVELFSGRSLGEISGEVSVRDEPIETKLRTSKLPPALWREDAPQEVSPAFCWASVAGDTMFVLYQRVPGSSTDGLLLSIYRPRPADAPPREDELQVLWRALGRQPAALQLLSTHALRGTFELDAVSAAHDGSLIALPKRRSVLVVDTTFGLSKLLKVSRPRGDDCAVVLSIHFVAFFGSRPWLLTAAEDEVVLWPRAAGHVCTGPVCRYGSRSWRQRG